MWASLSWAENVEDVWRKAFHNDYRVKSTKESTASAEENIAAAKYLGRPSLKSEAAYSKIVEISEAEFRLLKSDWKHQ